MKVAKVAFITLNYLPSTGGLVRYVQSFASELLKHGVEVDVFCSNGKDPNLPSQETIDNVKVSRYDLFSYPKALSIFTPIKASNAFKEKLELIDWKVYDFVVIRHIYGAYAATKIPDLLARAIYVCPLLSSRLQKINSHQSGLLYRIYSCLITPQLSWLEDRVFDSRLPKAVLSKSKLDELEEYFGRRLDVCIAKPGVDINVFCPINDSSISQLRAHWNLDNNDFVFCSVSRLVAEKNVSMLIEAFSIAFKNNSLAKLVIAGDGPLRSQLEKLVTQLHISHKVIFLGNVSSPQEVFQISDCFVLPSLYEGFGHVHLEANSCGVPSIGFANSPPLSITATEEILVDGYNGWVVKKINAEDMAECLSLAMARIKADPFRYKTNARNHVVENYTWVGHFNKLFENVESLR
jgi:glycosyltransferase involved in cell wall biosynthesis